MEGMHCPRCEAAVRQALAGATGLREIDVRYAGGTLAALWDANLISESEIDARLREAGYSLRPEAGRAPWLREIGQIILLLTGAALLYLLLTRTAVAEWISSCWR